MNDDDMTEEQIKALNDADLLHTAKKATRKRRDYTDAYLNARRLYKHYQDLENLLNDEKDRRGL